jgi:hypothetical protein
MMPCEPRPGLDPRNGPLADEGQCAAAHARVTIALSDYLHSLPRTEPLVWHLRHGLAQRLADVALAAADTPDAEYDRC